MWPKCKIDTEREGEEEGKKTVNSQGKHGASKAIRANSLKVKINLSNRTIATDTRKDWKDKHARTTSICTFPELYKSKYFTTVKRKQTSFECSTPKKGLSDNSMRMLCIVPHFTIYNSLRQLEIRIVKFSERDWKIWILPHHLMRNNWTIYAEPLCKGCGNL